jgi:formate-dependent nitrite reductase membrane component NrfD
MIEELIITTRANPRVDPGLEIWGWEISVYLFLGGLTAGIMFFGALFIILNRQEQARFVTRQLPLLAPIVLSLGMLMLFLDLERQLWVWRFYTSFQPTSPMSWGSWVLILIYPFSILLILTYLRQGYPWLANYLERIPYGKTLLNLSEQYRRPIAWGSAILAVFLGIYTGILLSAFSARPFWNTAILGPLFLISGLSTAAAVGVIGGRKTGECHLFTRIDIGLIILELILIALLIINLATGNALKQEALGHIMGGDYTYLFWVGFIMLGLVIPMIMETVCLRLSTTFMIILPPILILMGGYLLRDITVEVGQMTTWTQYEQQYNAELLDEIRRH